MATLDINHLVTNLNSPYPRVRERALEALEPIDREHYLNMADEFDPMGAWGPAPTLDDFDGEAITAARRYAYRHGIPLPWVIGSVDIAMEYVKAVEQRAGR